MQILEGLRDAYEAHHQVRFADGALAAAAELSDRYISDRFLPDKAIDLMDQAGARVRLRSAGPLHRGRQREDRIAKLRREQQEAVAGEDFERASEFKRQIAELEGELAGIEERREGVVSVTEADIADVVSRRTGIPVSPAHRQREGEAPQPRGGDALEDRRPERGGHRGLPGRAAQPRGHGRPQPPRGLLPLPGPHRRRQDRTREDPRRTAVRRRESHDPLRHERVPGEAHRRPPRRRAARIRRLRGGRPAHREGAPAAVQRRAVRRGGEGAPGRLQHPAPDPRRRTSHRRPGPHGRLPPLRHHHDVEHRRPPDPRSPGGRLRDQGRC